MDSYIEKIHELLLDENPRIPFRHIGRILKIYSKTASRLYRRALIEKILFPPMLRPRICIDYTEYVYMINAKSIESLFERLKKDHRVEYVTWCQGQFDLLLITNERIDLTVEEEFKDIVLGGEREDYIYPEIKHGDYRTSLKEINEFLDKKEFQLSKIVTEPRKRGNEWSDREERLFRYLKNDIRKTFIKIQKELGISRTLLLECYSRVRKHTIVTVPYYPMGFDGYTKFYIVMQTDYEQQAVDLLGRFPCYSAFFKARSLIGYVSIEKDLVYEFFCLMSKMTSTGFVKNLIFSVPFYYYSRD
jgi:phage pi2 protein 07